MTIGNKSPQSRRDFFKNASLVSTGLVAAPSIVLAFANPTTGMTGNTPGGQLLARQIGSAFAAFAKTGNPTNPTMPAWRAYDPSQHAVMVFDANTRLVNDPQSEIRQMWDEILAS